MHSLNRFIASKTGIVVKIYVYQALWDAKHTYVLYDLGRRMMNTYCFLEFRADLYQMNWVEPVFTFLWGILLPNPGLWDIPFGINCCKNARKNTSTEHSWDCNYHLLTKYLGTDDRTNLRAKSSAQIPYFW